jgi:cell pole-organizing protein PopZ
MGDMSAEPSMEDILSSIKRIIAEEGEPSSGARTARRPRPTPRPLESLDDHEEVLELSDPVEPLPSPRRIEAAREQPIIHREETRVPPSDAPTPGMAQPKRQAAEQVRWDAPDPIVSRAAAEASRGALDQLSRLVVKPETPGAETLEGLVREMLKPMLRDWLDAHLPRVVEAAVEREVARIAGRQG